MASNGLLEESFPPKVITPKDRDLVVLSCETLLALLLQFDNLLIDCVDLNVAKNVVYIPYDFVF